MKINDLPKNDLKFYGILDENESFSKKLSEKDIENFLSGGTIIAENDRKRLTFKLLQDKTLDVKMYERGIINHANLTNSGIIAAVNDDKILYKSMADYGAISQIGKIFDSVSNEEKTFVELENERGKTKFYGDDDLGEKLKDFSVFDKVQILISDLKKTEFADENGEVFNRFDNVYDIKKLDNENKEYAVKAYQFNENEKTIEEFDLKKNIAEITQIIGEKQDLSESNRYKTELEKLRSFMLDKVDIYPEAVKEIMQDVNIVSKEIDRVNNVPDNSKLEAEHRLDLQVNDPDMYDDAREKQETIEREEQDENLEEGETRTKSKGIRR